MKRLILTLAALTALSACGDPSFVEKVTIANPYEYDVIAAVSGDGVSWLNLGGLNRGAESTRLQVIDMGERWFFQFRYPHDNDVEPAVVSMSRAGLAAAGWRIEVPQAFARTLRERGEPASFDG